MSAVQIRPCPFLSPPFQPLPTRDNRSSKFLLFNDLSVIASAAIFLSVLPIVANRLHPEKGVGVDLGVNLLEVSEVASAVLSSVPVGSSAWAIAAIVICSGNSGRTAVISGTSGDIGLAGVSIRSTEGSTMSSDISGLSETNLATPVRFRCSAGPGGDSSATLCTVLPARSVWDSYPLAPVCPACKCGALWYAVRSSDLSGEHRQLRLSNGTRHG